MTSDPAFRLAVDSHLIRYGQSEHAVAARGAYWAREKSWTGVPGRAADLYILSWYPETKGHLVDPGPFHAVGRVIFKRPHDFAGRERYRDCMRG